MSVKYSLNDVLLEAGVLDYAKIKADWDWIPSDGHTRRMKKIYKKEKDSKSGALVKALYGVAAAALLFIVIVSVKPLREGAASLFSGLFGNEDSDTVTADITSEPDMTDNEDIISKAEDNSGVSEPQTESEDTETEAETEAPTDEEAAANIIEDIVNNGFTKEKWYELKSYDKTAYLYCIDTYFNKKCDQSHRTVYSVFCIELAAPEIRRNMPEVAERYEKILSLTSDVLHNKPYYGYHNELQKFRSAMEETISPQLRKSDTYKHLYYTDLMLDYLDYSYYRAGSPGTFPEEYQPTTKLLAENVAFLKVHGLQAYKQSFLYAVMQYDEGIGELLDMYYASSDTNEKAVLSVMLALCIQHYDREDISQMTHTPLSEFFGDEGYSYLISVNEAEIKNYYVNTDISGYTDWIDSFLVYLKEAASVNPEITVREDRPMCYKILQYLGFDNYYVCGEYESGVEAVLSEFMELYDGITCGSVYVDRRDEYFSNQPSSDNPLPDALIKKIKEFVPDYDPETVDDGYPPYDFTYSTLKGDIRTADGLQRRFAELLDEADLARYPAGYENENFLIVDGIVYMIIAPREGGYFIRAYIQPGSVKVTERGDGYTVVTANVRWSKDRSENHTFYINNESGKIMNKGTFFEEYIKKPAD